MIFLELLNNLLRRLQRRLPSRFTLNVSDDVFRDRPRPRDDLIKRSVRAVGAAGLRVAAYRRFQRRVIKMGPEELVKTCVCTPQSRSHLSRSYTGALQSVELGRRLIAPVECVEQVALLVHRARN